MRERKSSVFLRILGTSKKKLSKIIMYESLYIGFYGSILGILVGIVSVFSIIPIIQKKSKFAVFDSFNNEFSFGFNI